MDETAVAALLSRGFATVPLAASGAAAALDAERLWEDGLMERTPKELLDGYLGMASTWTYELDVEDGESLVALDAELEALGAALAGFLPRPLRQRCAGLLHCARLDREEEQEPPPPHAEQVSMLLSHCGTRKVVLLYAFGSSGLVLRPRSDLSNELSICLKPGHVLVYLHELVIVSVDFCCQPAAVPHLPRVTHLGLLLQLDLLFEEGPRHEEEMLFVPETLVEECRKLVSSMDAESPLRMLKDAPEQKGMGIVSFHAALPSLPRGGGGVAAGIEAALMGGLDTVTPVVAPPKRGALGEEQYFGAKWDLSEYYDETCSGFKFYCKHLSVLYRSFDVAADFDYQLFGLSMAEGSSLEQRGRLLCEGLAEILHEDGDGGRGSERDWGLFCGLSGAPEVWNPGCFTSSSATLCKVSQAFDLTGPLQALDVDACSGLAACDAAVRQLRGGGSGALVSSAHWIGSPWEVAGLCMQGLIARSGRTRCFDQSQDGFTRGEGAVVMLLQPGGGRGEIVGSAMNSQGARLSAPSAPALMDLAARAARDAATAFAAVDVAEVAGEGLAALALALRHSQGVQAPVAVGCAQASWSHLGPVSGLVGLTRCLLLSAAKLSGPQNHLKQLAPDIPWDKESRLHFCTEVMTGVGQGGPQLCSVTAFGAGSNCQQLLVVKHRLKEKAAARPAWWPTELQKKDAFIVTSGYYLVGSMGAWKQGLLLEQDGLGFTNLITLRHGVERFQIWVDEDENRVLYPGPSQVLGPESDVPRWKSWRLSGCAGERYEIRLQVNGKYMQLSWQKVSFTPIPVPIGELSIVGDHNFWHFQAMQCEEGLHHAEVVLLKERSHFQIACDQDFDQCFYPQEGTEDVAGPDEYGYGRNFELCGEVGQVFRVDFAWPGRVLRVATLGQRAVDFEDLAKEHRYYVAGSWDDWAKCQEMKRDERGNFSLEVLRRGRFQILLNRNWMCTVHPDVKEAALDDEYQLEGPDDGGHERYWLIGDEVERGSAVLIHLEMEKGRPSKVWWEAKENHERRCCEGLRKTLARHLEVHGLVPAGRKPARLTKAPEFYNVGRRKEETNLIAPLERKLQSVKDEYQAFLAQEGVEVRMRRALEGLTG